MIRYNFRDHVTLLLEIMFPGKVSICLMGNGDVQIERWEVPGVARPDDLEEFFNANIDVLDEEAKRVARAERDKRLHDCDWTQLHDVPGDVQEAYRPYRQALRDVPAQEGFPHEIEWPIYVHPEVQNLMNIDVNDEN